MTDAPDLALPSGYTDLLGELKKRARAARINARLVLVPNGGCRRVPVVGRDIDER